MARRDRSSSRRAEGRGPRKPREARPARESKPGRESKPARDAGRPPRHARPPRPPREDAAASPSPPPHKPGRMIIYGRNAVREALRGRRTVRRIWATAGAAKEGWSGAPLSVVAAEEVESRAGSDGHQGICAEVDAYPYVDAAELLALEAPLLVALDEVTDPQNLGAICRTAECAGAAGVIVPERRSAEVTPAVCKASAGAVEHLPVARVRNLADFLAEAKEAGCWCYGAAAGARTSYDKPEYSGGVVVVLGAEGRGLRPRVAAACDDLVALPLRGRIESLNVSATAAVLLYEILQQRLDTST
jgi:23S rRNA (guanosine2251-2'-O)-methyltransferase